MIWCMFIERINFYLFIYNVFLLFGDLLLIKVLEILLILFIGYVIID